MLCPSFWDDFIPRRNKRKSQHEKLVPLFLSLSLYIYIHIYTYMYTNL